MPSLNNEVDIMTVGGVDNDIRDTYTRAAIGMTEPLAVASAAHRVNEVFFSAADRLLYKAIDDIAIGDTFTPDVNVVQATLSDMMYQLFAQSPELLLQYVIGNYEKTATASKTYKNNDLIVWRDGMFYRVVGTVSQGTAWVVDSNIIAEPGLAELVSDLENTKDEKVVLSQRLVAGETTLTFTDDSINDDCLIEPFTEIWGRNPLTITQSGHSATLTFKAQAESMTVLLVIREV